MSTERHDIVYTGEEEFFDHPYKIRDRKRLMAQADAPLPEDATERFAAHRAQSAEARALAAARDSRERLLARWVFKKKRLVAKVKGVLGHHTA